MTFEVLLHRDVRKYLTALDRDEERRCYDALKRCLKDDPRTRRSGCDVKVLHGRGRRAYRLRVGDHRVVYVVAGDEVRVVEAFRRGRGYR